MRCVAALLVCLALTVSAFPLEDEGSGDDGTRPRPEEKTTWCYCHLQAKHPFGLRVFDEKLSDAVGETVRPVKMFYENSDEGCNKLYQQCAEHCMSFDDHFLEGKQTQFSVDGEMKALADYACAKMRQPVVDPLSLHVVSHTSCNAVVRYTDVLSIAESLCCGRKKVNGKRRFFAEECIDEDIFG